MPDANDPFLEPNWNIGDKMSHIFHFLQSHMVLRVVSPFSWIFNAISSDKSCLISMLLLLTYIDVRIAKFSCLPNPDWSIQMSGKLPWFRVGAGIGHPLHSTLWSTALKCTTDFVSGDYFLEHLGNEHLLPNTCIKKPLTISRMI